MLPAELQALIDQIDRCEGDATRLVEDLDDEGVNWTAPPQARVGAWSVAQCLTHLILMNEFYLRGWPQAVSKAAAVARGPFQGLGPTVVGRWFVRSMEPPVKLKTWRPHPTRRPG
jgi:hypothetical protein